MLVPPTSPLVPQIFLHLRSIHDPKYSNCCHSLRDATLPPSFQEQLQPDPTCRLTPLSPSLLLYPHSSLQIGSFGTLLILLLHVRQQGGGVALDTASQIIAFAIVNIHLRVRFKFSTLVTLSVHIAIIGRMIVSPNKFESSKKFGNYSYSILVSLMTLFQSYLREKAIRENYKHLQMLQEDTMTSQLLLENMLPRAIHAKQLLLGELVFDELHNVTLLYSDIKGFTPLSANMDSQVLTKLLNLIYSAFDRHLEHFGLYKVGQCPFLFFSLSF